MGVILNNMLKTTVMTAIKCSFTWDLRPAGKAIKIEIFVEGFCLRWWWRKGNGVLRA